MMWSDTKEYPLNSWILYKSQVQTHAHNTYIMDIDMCIGCTLGEYIELPSVVPGAHKEKERLTTGITSRNWL